MTFGVCAEITFLAPLNPTVCGEGCIMQYPSDAGKQCSFLAFEINTP